MNENEVSDRVAIQLLLARYNIEGDRGRIEALAVLFAPDGTLRFNGHHCTGPQEIMAQLTGAVRNPALTLTRHHLASSLIELDGDTARGRTYFQVLTDIGLDHHGVYVDLLERHEGGWRFKDRHVRIDGQARNSLFRGLHVRGVLVEDPALQGAAAG